jgi:hypothetical protein
VWNVELNWFINRKFAPEKLDLEKKWPSALRHVTRFQKLRPPTPISELGLEGQNLCSMNEMPKNYQLQSQKYRYVFLSGRNIDMCLRTGSDSMSGQPRSRTPPKKGWTNKSRGPSAQLINPFHQVLLRLNYFGQSLLATLAGSSLAESFVPLICYMPA